MSMDVTLGRFEVKVPTLEAVFIELTSKKGDGLSYGISNLLEEGFALNVHLFKNNRAAFMLLWPYLILALLLEAIFKINVGGN